MHPNRGNGGRKAAFILHVLICLAVLTLAACGGSYGSLQRSSETNRKFESIEISDIYNYYYTGSYYKPMAIIGVIKEYTLISKLWKPVDLTPARLSGWVDQMTDFRGYALSNFGSNILNEHGQVIGIWYSPVDFTTVRMLEDKQFWIYPPRDSPMFGGDEAYYVPKKKKQVKTVQHVKDPEHLSLVNSWPGREAF